MQQRSGNLRSMRPVWKTSVCYRPVISTAAMINLTGQDRTYPGFRLMAWHLGISLAQLRRLMAELSRSFSRSYPFYEIQANYGY